MVSISNITDLIGVIDAVGVITLDFNVDYVFQNSMNLSADSYLQVDQNYTFGMNMLNVDGAAIAAGTYSGTGLTDLGANFVDNGGSITVVPEPSTLAFLFLSFSACVVS